MAKMIIGEDDEPYVRVKSQCRSPLDSFLNERDREVIAGFLRFLERSGLQENYLRGGVVKDKFFGLYGGRPIRGAVPMASVSPDERSISSLVDHFIRSDKRGIDIQGVRYIVDMEYPIFSQEQKLTKPAWFFLESQKKGFYKAPFICLEATTTGLFYAR